MDDETPTQSMSRSRWATAAWIVSSLLLVLLVVGLWLRVERESSGANLSAAIIKGTRPMAPALPTEPVVKGSSTKIPDGHVVVVNWWASWCGPCIREAPALAEIAHEYEGRVTVVGLNAGNRDMKSQAREFAREHELDFVLVRGDRADEETWGRPIFPQTYVVGTDGRISSYVAGEIDKETLSGLLDDELAHERNPEPQI